MAINHLIRQATTDPKKLAENRNLEFNDLRLSEWPKMPRLFGYVAPFYSQAKTLSWGLLKYYSAPIPGIKINESELKITYPGGGEVRLFGADNTESLRGIKWWELVLDEFKDHPIGMWQDVLAPGCIDTQAPITFLGTIKGRDKLWRLYENRKNDLDWQTFYIKASESGILSQEFLEAEKKLIGEAKYLQEYELEPMATIEGAIWGGEMRWLRDNNHITEVPLESLAFVDTFFDLGIGDHMVVVFIQRVGLEAHVIDHYEAQNVGLPSVVKVLEGKGYNYGTHYLPHDARQRELQTEKTREQYLRNVLRGQVEVLPRPRIKEDSIEAFRLHYRKLWIDKKLEALIDSMEMYSQEFDEKLGVYRKIPLHNMFSHACDAMQLWAQLEQKNLSLYQNTGIIDSVDAEKTSDFFTDPESENLIPGIA